jgi:allantoicase
VSDGRLPLVDLASRARGGSVMAASDESFGEKENLLVDALPDVRPGRYGHKGELVDGWETRRQRGPRSHGAHDWALVRLGVPGRIEEIVVDTTGFTGNQPPFVRIEGVQANPHEGAESLLGGRTAWRELVPTSPVKPDGRNAFPVGSNGVVTHLLVTIFPDGGVARLRVNGTIVADLEPYAGLTVNLLAAELGARVVEQSDGFYSGAGNLLQPGPARDMSEGWEARRLRSTEPDRHDWVVFALAAPGVPALLEVDTRWFVANASESIAVFGHPGAGDVGDGAPGDGDPGWVPLLERTELVPDAPHRWRVDTAQPVRFLRVDAFPDGGLSRVRLLGSFD